MKHFKKIALLLLSAVFLTVLPTTNTLKVSAEGPTTHLVIYDVDSKQWSCRVGGSNWDDSEPAEHWETYYLENQTFKDGDILVIEGSPDDDAAVLNLNLGNHHISNLTIKPNTNVIPIIAGTIDECYILDDSTASITGYIINAYVYDDASVTFCSDVANLNIRDSKANVHATVGCQGTVGHLIAKDDADVIYEYYNIAKGRLNVENGDLKTDAAYYSTTPSASAPAAPQSAPQAPAASNASNDYDKVPKTGDNSVSLPLLLAGIAVVCFAGRTALKRV